MAISDFCWAPEDAVAETLKSLHQNEGAQLGAFYTSCVSSSTSDSLVEQIDQTATYVKDSLYIQCSEIFTLRNEKLHTEA